MPTHRKSTGDHPPGDVPLDSKVAFLRRREAYGDSSIGIRSIETHTSWVFLTERHAYKLKKPVRRAFLDFTTLEARRFDCEEEVRLNRRLARGVYVGTVPLVVDSRGALRLGGREQVVDWLVKMHRLPAKDMLDHAIASRALVPEDIRPVARFLARFYRDAVSMRVMPHDYRQRLERDIKANLGTLREALSASSRPSVDGLADRMQDFMRRQSRLFDQRIAEHRIVEGHGDLRPEHVLLGPRSAIIDCVEFDRALRILDPVEELACLAVECERMNAPDFVAATFLQEYRRLTGDELPSHLVSFHMSQRACLRAKLAWWHLHEPAPKTVDHWRSLALRYLRLAESHAERLL